MRALALLKLSFSPSVNGSINNLKTIAKYTNIPVHRLEPVYEHIKDLDLTNPLNIEHIRNVVKYNAARHMNANSTSSNIGKKLVLAGGGLGAAGAIAYANQ